MTRGDGPPDERDRTRLEGVLPEALRKLLEAGQERLAERPELLRSVLGELRLPRELLQLALQQLEESKNVIQRTAAREIREFLDKTDLGEELVRALTRVQLEVTTTVRFTPRPAPPPASAPGPLDPSPATPQASPEAKN